MRTRRDAFLSSVFLPPSVAIIGWVKYRLVAKSEKLKQTRGQGEFCIYGPWTEAAGDENSRISFKVGICFSLLRTPHRGGE